MATLRYIKDRKKKLDPRLSMEMGDVILVGGRPSMGKTTFATTLADKMCANDGVSCIYFSLEMTEKQLLEGYLKDGNENIKEALIIDDTPAMTVDEIVKKSREFAKEKQTSLIVIDYLQLMSETEDVFLKLKELAKELFCVILVLGQLSREVDTREDKMPRVSDFKGIKHPEDLADEIWLLYEEGQ